MFALRTFRSIGTVLSVPTLRSIRTLKKIPYLTELIATSITEEMSNIRFFHWKVEEAISLGTFSQTYMKLSKAKENKETICEELSDLVKFNHTLLTKDSDDAGLNVLISYLATCSNIAWDPYKGQQTELHVFYYILKTLIFPLSKGIITELNYYNQFTHDNITENISTAPLGLGLEHLWHGKPDARAIGWLSGDVNVLLREAKLDGDADSDDNGDDNYGWKSDEYGQQMVLEGKQTRKAKNLSQLVCAAVVSSFTEKNICGKEMNPMTPVIMIDGLKYQVALYDCNRDILLISDNIPLCLDTKLFPDAVCALFIFMNHRSYLNEIVEVTTREKSGIKKFFEYKGVLEQYESMADRNVSSWKATAHIRGLRLAPSYSMKKDHKQ